jgi:two-component system alkaline phosphatase synthesis response regulator PhoP
MPTVLVVDDEPAIVTLLRYNLEKAGYLVLTQTDGSTVLDFINSQQIDLVLLDIMLPGSNGMELMQRIRQSGNRVPIILITAVDEEVDRILGLEMGADDYMTKPFSPREVIARVKAVLRRYDATLTAGAQSDAVVTLGKLSIDTDKMAVQKNGHLVKLTPKEYELLQYMLERKNRVLDRETLLHGVWGFDNSGPDTRMVDMHMSHLREKLEDDPKNPILIKTVRGFGYRFDTSEVEES